MKRPLIGFCRFWYDFIVGDDWRLAITVAFAIGATALGSRLTDWNLWWVVMVAVAVALPMSIYGVVRRNSWAFIVSVLRLPRRTPGRHKVPTPLRTCPRPVMPRIASAHCRRHVAGPSQTSFGV